MNSLTKNRIVENRNFKLQTEPKIKEATKARYAELMEKWKPLQAEGTRLLETPIPAFNKLASEKGVGVLFVK